MSDCPPINVIDDFVAGRAADDAVRAHIEKCSECNAQAERMRNENALLSHVVQALPSDLTSTTGGGFRVEGYQILAELQRGGQGAVYRAIQQSTRRHVALKVLLGGPFATPQQRRRFEREIDIVGRLHHPAIVTLYDSGVTRGRYFFAMEYVDGQRLDVFLAKNPLLIRGVVKLFVRICAGVEHAHSAGLMHRDLKPSNILIDEHGEPRILDFGLARESGDGGDTGLPLVTTQQNLFLGTFAYAAPEQIRGERQRVGPRSDVYALGVMLHEALTQTVAARRTGDAKDYAGMPLGEAVSPPSTLNPKISRDLDAIVMRCLEEDPDRRYRTAGALAEDLERYLLNEPVDARRGDRGYTTYVLAKAARRHWPAVIVVALLLAVIAVGGAMLLRRPVPAQPTVDATGGVAFIDDLLSSANTEWEAGHDRAMVEAMLDRASKKLNTDYANDPVLRVRLGAALGKGYIAIDRPTDAQRELEDARAVLDAIPDAPTTLQKSVLRPLRDLYKRTKQTDKADKLSVLLGSQQ